MLTAWRPNVIRVRFLFAHYAHAVYRNAYPVYGIFKYTAYVHGEIFYTLLLLFYDGRPNGKQVYYDIIVYGISK